MPSNTTFASRCYSLFGNAWGKNRIAGKAIRAADNSPMPGKIYLLKNPSFLFVRIALPDPATGAYLFEHIAAGTYTVIADDAEGVFNSAIARPVPSEPM
ncbi:MAG: hypothetical protein LBQ81_07320 [Zoogloeaceae bacterium]|jgi:hypothetical protein|nr:hypothetical protein [Zoogloeaceae bacterium]